MYYVLRLAEAGREAQEPRSRVRPDVLAVVGERLPDVRVTSWVGRIVVESAEDVLDVLTDIHGVLSVSPCTLVDLDQLSDAVDVLAGQRVPGASSFRVLVKRTGEHSFNSHQKAAELGGRVLRLFRDVRVDLEHPDVIIGVEIRDRDCYVFSEIVPGLDRREQDLVTPGAWPKFLVDQMLGRLLPWFRLLGFDTITVLDEADSLLQRVARAENRVLLTKDYELSLSHAVNVYYVDASEPMAQVAEVLAYYNISVDPARMFTRCTQCNAGVRQVDKREFADRIPEPAYTMYDEFHHCSGCDKLYWKGAQYERIVDQLGQL